MWKIKNPSIEITLEAFIHSHVKGGTAVYTDGSRVYRELRGFDHETVIHSWGE